MTKRVSSFEFLHPWKRLKLSESSDLFAKNYEKMQENYLKDNFTQQIVLILKSILKSSLIPAEHKSLPLLRMFQEICKELLINDLEATMWKLYLESGVWGDNTKPLSVLLLFSAFAAKSSMNFENEVEIIRTCLENKYPGFSKGYDNWFNLHSDELRVSLRDFNKCFNTVVGSCLRETVDYNFYVDDLLQIAPPGANVKEQKFKFSLEPEDFKSPELMNLNSILMNEDPVLKLERSLSIAQSNGYDLENIENYEFELPSITRFQSLIDI